MKMASPSPSIFLFLSVILVSSLLPNPSMSSASSSSPARRHRHHRHHHRHHHGDQQQAAGHRSAKGMRAAEVIARGDGERGEKHNAQQEAGDVATAADGILPRAAVAMTTQSAIPAGVVSAKADRDAKPKGEESNQQPRRPEQPDDGQTTRHPAKQPSDQLSSTPSPSPESPSNKSALPRKSQQPDISNQTSVQNKALDTTTEKNEKHLPGHANQDDNDNEEDGIPHNAAVPEMPVGSSNDKRVNRPRWRHTLRQNEKGDDGNNSEAGQQRPVVNDNRSRNRLRNNKGVPSAAEVNPDPQPGHQLAPPSGSTPDPDPVPRRWDDNRPRWNTPRQSGEESEPSSRLNRSTAIPPKNMSREGKVVDNQQRMMNETGEVEAKAAKSKKGVKQSKKGKSRKKGKALLKECPGCSEMKVKMAKAKELHKQVLRTQLLDKLRLVPTFQKQPWPPKLPEQVFPDMAQRDQGHDEDRYYARPTQLILLGSDLGPRDRLKKPGTGTYQFSVGGKVKHEVISAWLWVYKMRDANDVHEQTLVITELRRTKRRRLRERSLVARLDTHVQEGWVNFDVTRLVRRWIENETPASLQLLAIRCKTCHRTNYRAIFGIKSHFLPVLVIRESREQARPREQRSECDPTNGCCKFDMTVTFEELGIHEIFRPLSIKADYCFGTCNRPDLYYYNHTMITQHMIFNSHVNNATLRERLEPCCVPVVLREASIHYYLNDGLDIQTSLVPNLLVDRCGCA